MNGKAQHLDAPWLSLPDATATLGQSRAQLVWLIATGQIRARYMAETNTLEVNLASLENWMGAPIREGSRS
jgi:hypothetical protein